MNSVELSLPMTKVSLANRLTEIDGQGGNTAASCGRFARLREHWQAGSAFSLVEVVLAIGIVSFAFVGLFGLLPAGLTVFRQAIDNSVGSQIVQRLVNEAQQTDFPVLTAAAPTKRYFDDQGNEVTSANESLYTAEVSVLAKTEMPAAATRATESLATITIKLANNPAHNSSPFDPGSKVPYATYFAYIAKSQ